MKVIYNHSDSYKFNYSGCLLEKSEAMSLLQKDVKEKLLDEPQRKDFLADLKNLKNETGFEKSAQLLLDIQALANEKVNAREFEIGEVLAEVILEKDFSCKFYWNKLRDARNPKGNMTGADLVGFIQYDNEVFFLFGEVKTSSEDKSPPQVLTQKKEGMIDQLKDLYNNDKKRKDLISYLRSKIDLNENIKNDFSSAIRSYYLPDNNYQLFGILIRDTEANENDLKTVYDTLKETILEPTGIRLLAVYMPVKKEIWLSIINHEEEL